MVGSRGWFMKEEGVLYDTKSSTSGHEPWRFKELVKVPWL